MSDFFGRLIASILLIFALSALLLCAGMALDDLITRPSLQEVNEKMAMLSKWQTAPGQIDEVKVWTLGNHPWEKYKATLSYHYTVEERIYQGNCLSLTRCFYIGKGIDPRQDVMNRMWRYMSSQQAGPEQIVNLVGSNYSTWKLTPYVSNKQVKVFYDPMHPETAVLDNVDFQNMSYAGRNPYFKPYHWNDYYGAPLFILLFFGSLSLYFFQIFFGLLFHTHHTAPVEPNHLMISKSEGQIHDFNVIAPGHSAAVSMLGFFLLLCAFEIWMANLHQAITPPKPGETALILFLVGIFGVPGLFFLCVRNTFQIDLVRHSVTRIRKIWLILYTLTFKRDWPVSAFDRVEIKMNVFSSKGSTFHFCFISLMFKNSTKQATLLSSQLPSSIIPQSLIDRAEQIAKMLGLPCQIVK